MRAIGRLMRIEGNVGLVALPKIVWEIINNPNSMQSCVPGCAGFQTLGVDAYRATVEVGVGALHATAEVDLRLSDKHPLEGYRLDVSAHSFASSVTGSGTVALTPQGEGTLLSYAGEVHTTGVLAALGQSFLSGLVEDLAAQFFAGLGKLATQRSGSIGKEAT